MNKSILYIFVMLTFPCLGNSIQVEDYRSPDKTDREIIQEALDELGQQGHGKIEFDGSKTYTIDNCLLLPKYNNKVKGRNQFIIEGNGCIIEISEPTSCGFYRKPNSQKEALNEMMRFRFLIQNFT